MARDDKGKKRRDRRALRKSSKAKKPIQEQSVPQEGSTLSNVVSETSVTDNTQEPSNSNLAGPANQFDFSGMSEKDETDAIDKRTREFVDILKPLYTSEKNKIGAMTEEGAERLLYNKPLQELEAEVNALNSNRATGGSQPLEQLKSLSELPDSDKELLSQDKNVATSLINDAASNPKLTSGEFAEASKEASEIEKKVNEKNTQDVLSLNESNNQVEPVIEEPTQSTEQEVNLAQSQTGGEGGTEQTGGAPPLGGTGGTLTSIAPPIAGQKPEIINQPNAKIQIGSSIIKGSPNQSLLKQLNAANRISTIEDLDVKDYYPEAGRDIAVGNFTGSRIGSQTIYSGAGVLAPMGLYDARNRALKNEAQKKIKLLNEIMQIPEAPAQFQVKYGEAAYDRVMSILNEVDFDVNKLYATPDAMKEINRIKDIATEMSYYDKFSQDLLDASTPKEGVGSNRYVSPEMLEYARKIRTAMVNDVDKIVNGEVSLQKYFEDSGVYLEPYKWADDRAKEIFAADRLSESPLKLKNVNEAAADAKKKGEIFDPVAYEKERNDFIASVNDGNKATDTYVTGLVKFFDSDNLRNLVESAYDGKNFPKKTKEDVYKYLLSQAPMKTVLNYQTTANAYTAEMREAGVNRRFNADQARLKEKDKTFFGLVGEDGIISDAQLEQSLTGDPTTDAAIIKDELTKTSTGGNVKTGKNGQYFIEFKIPSNEKLVYERTSSTKGKFQAYKENGEVVYLTATQVASYSGNLYTEDRKLITPNEKNAYDKISEQPETFYSKPEYVILQKGYQAGGGGITYLKSSNATAWKDSKNKVETATFLNKGEYVEGNTTIGLSLRFKTDESTVNLRTSSGQMRANSIVKIKDKEKGPEVQTSTVTSESNTE